MNGSQNLIYVGEPLNMDGTESDIMKTVESFVKNLRKISKIECEYMMNDLLVLRQEKR
jgi:RNase H-fold protein (predicted Holliday junction resolvase)